MPSGHFSVCTLLYSPGHGNQPRTMAEMQHLHTDKIELGMLHYGILMYIMLHYSTIHCAMRHTTLYHTMLRYVILCYAM